MAAVVFAHRLAAAAGTKLTLGIKLSSRQKAREAVRCPAIDALILERCHDVHRVTVTMLHAQPGEAGSVYLRLVIDCFLPMDIYQPRLEIGYAVRRGYANPSPPIHDNRRHS